MRNEIAPNCTTILAFTGTICTIIGAVVLLAGYMVNVQSNNSYTRGICQMAQGAIYETTCQEPKPGCYSCHVPCWNAFYALTVVPGAIAYFFKGTYFSEAAANNSINYKIGVTYGICYYKNGGADIIMQLADVHGTLIAGVVFMGLATAIFLGGFASWCESKSICKRCKFRCSGKSESESTISHPTVTIPTETSALATNVQYSVNANSTNGLA